MTNNSNQSSCPVVGQDSPEGKMVTVSLTQDEAMLVLSAVQARRKQDFEAWVHRDPLWKVAGMMNARAESVLGKITEALR